MCQKNNNFSCAWERRGKLFAFENPRRRFPARRKGSSRAWVVRGTSERTNERDKTSDFPRAARGCKPLLRYFDLRSSEERKSLASVRSVYVSAIPRDTRLTLASNRLRFDFMSDPEQVSYSTSECRCPNRNERLILPYKQFSRYRNGKPWPIEVDTTCCCCCFLLFRITTHAL